jgi:phosphomannomutase
LKRYAKTPELNIAISNREAAIDCLASHFTDADISWVDGVKIVYPDWWVNARPAANEDLLRINIEADTPELLEEKKKEIWNLLKQ